MKNHLLIIITLVILTGCKEDESSIISKQSITGYAQKGPFLGGSVVTFYELSADLNQTGVSYNTQVSNNLGYFEIEEVTFVNRYIQVQADGFYYDEFLDADSDSEIILNALVDVLEQDEININLLTHLEKERVENLIDNGLDFNTAKDSAQHELLSIFGIVGQGIPFSENLDITTSAQLLGITSIIKGNRDHSQLNQLLIEFINDFKNDGTLDDLLKAKLYNGAQVLDLSEVRINIESYYYKQKGLAVILPDFEFVIINYLGEKPFNIELVVKNVDCNGSNSGTINLTIDGGTNPFTYKWSNGTVTESIKNVGPGIYSVAVYDANNYVLKANNIEVTEPEPLTIDIVETHVTTVGGFDGSIDLTVTGGIAPYVYTWSDGSESSDLLNISAGNYTVTVIDDNKCEISQSTTIRETVSDIDGNVYKTVVIGPQTWMAENLKTTTFTDGTAIPLVENLTEWNNLTTQGYSWYENDEGTYGSKYGALYNWYTVSTEKVCPAGWHVPTDEEWSELANYLSTNEQSSSVCSLMAKNAFIYGLGTSCGGSDIFGFTALPGGRRHDGNFSAFGVSGIFWTGTENSQSDAWHHYMDCWCGDLIKYPTSKNDGLSVRCLMD